MSRTRSRNTRVLTSSLGGTLECTNGGTTTFSLDGIQWPPGVKVINLDPQLARFAGEVSTITDEPGSIQSRSIHPYRSVLHSKDEWSGSSDPVTLTWQTSHPSQPSNKVTWKAVVPWCANSDALSQPSPPTMSDAELQQIAIGQLKPGMVSPKLDLPLFIAELSDFADIWSGMAKLLTDRGARKSLPRMVESLYVPFGKSSPPRGAMNRTFAVLDRLVGADLFWKLALRPFLQEGSRLIELLSNLQSSYNTLSSQLPVFLRGRAEDSGYHSSTFLPHRWHRRTMVTTKTVEVVAWAAVKRDYSNVSFWDHTRGTFGLTPRLQTAWELIPFSFVIDYVVNIGKWLSQFDGSALTVPYQVLGKGISIKKTSISSVVVYPFRGTSPIMSPGNVPVPSGTRSNKTYNRNPSNFEFGSQLQPLQTRLPNLSQIGTVAELIYAITRSKH